VVKSVCGSEKAGFWSAKMLWVLLIIFWAVVPGLITGWMFRERGRRFAPGFLLGVVCGPLGILAALAFTYFSDRRRARGRGGRRGRAVRVFYDIPVVGQLHVSTVWALAGVATFLCLWMVGGIFFELQREIQTPANSERAAAKPQDKLPSNGLPPSTSNASTPAAADSKLPAASQSNNSAQQQAALLGISVQPPAAGAHPENSNAPSAVSSNTSGATIAPSQPYAGSSAMPTPSATSSAAPTPTEKAAAVSRETVASEVARALSSMGHRVHAALSGEGRSTTLSLSGATLTREAGSQLLGNGRLRESLKAAGVRIVVMVNGQESWTYIL
jgi:hypothetical protein